MSRVSELTPEERARLAELTYYEPPEPVHHEPRFPFLRKLAAPFVALGALLLKFGGVLLQVKFLFSMFVSAAFYVWFGGWWFGLGLVLLLFVHEMGHVLEAKRQGLPVSAPLFIPFLGALITLKQMPHNAWNEAKLAIAGPILGSLGAAVDLGRTGRDRLAITSRRSRSSASSSTSSTCCPSCRSTADGSSARSIRRSGWSASSALARARLRLAEPDPDHHPDLLAAWSSGSAGRPATTRSSRTTTA